MRLVEEPDIALIAGATPVMIGAVLPAIQDRLVLMLSERPSVKGVLGSDHEGRSIAAGLAKGLLQPVEFG